MLNGTCDGFKLDSFALNMWRVTFLGREGEPPVSFQVCAGACPKE
jgi:hypothetical protein